MLSVVVPCFNEEAVIEATHQRLGRVLDALAIPSEIVYVDDGSSDATFSHLSAIQARDARVRVVRLSRNFGHQFASTAGLQHASGDAVVLIDADLQDPPELISEMLARWNDGFAVVYGTRTTRTGEGWFKQATAKMFYRLINRVSEVPIPLDTGDFRLMDRRVVNAVLSMPERDRFLRGMVAWAGFRQTPLPYAREPRSAGQSKYPLRKMLHFAGDGILSFSLTPLKFATILGFVASALAMLGIVYALVVRFETHSWVPGWASIFLAVLFMGGVQLICLGILGEYLGRIYGESKRRPLYFVAEKLGFSADPTSSREKLPETYAGRD
ncbi:MAG: glycosyltransferase family 2 protein [Terriglobales bacterium]